MFPPTVKTTDAQRKLRAREVETLEHLMDLGTPTPPTLSAYFRTQSDYYVDWYRTLHELGYLSGWQPPPNREGEK